VGPDHAEAAFCSIMNNGSIAGHQAGRSTSMIYGAAKAAVNHLSKYVAMELASTTCASTRCHPGPLPPASCCKALGIGASKADALATQMQDVYAKAQPIPRSGVPDDIAQCVLWLACDRSSFVNATDIVVDGGLIGGAMFSPHHEGLGQVRARFGSRAPLSQRPWRCRCRQHQRSASTAS
jgi:NAD(P)-dependent dehydrogenase (short-subunit alcohol dehydrogenase family)